MSIDVLKKATGIAALMMLLGSAPLSWGQIIRNDSMQVLRENLMADKKLVVATHMKLTESEAKSFWPIYDEYQKDLQKINRRLQSLLASYAADFRRNSLTDDKAQKMIDELIAIKQAEVDLLSVYGPKLNKVLPVIKAARYLQIENKIRAIANYDLAQGVPLVQ